MTDTRSQASLRCPPPPVAELVGFPTRTIGRNRVVWRVIRDGHHPWWFSASLQGRFDLPDPQGTCYLALDPLSALLEVIGAPLPGGVVPATVLAERRLIKLRPPQTWHLADLISRRAAGFGVTLEISTIVPYDCPQAWAASLRSAGPLGLLYFVRHDPAAGQGIALFGSQGERVDWSPGSELPIEPPLRRRLREECGIEILDIPQADELEMAP